MYRVDKADVCLHVKNVFIIGLGVTMQLTSRTCNLVTIALCGWSEFPCEF